MLQKFQVIERGHNNLCPKIKTDFFFKTVEFIAYKKVFSIPCLGMSSDFAY